MNPLPKCENCSNGFCNKPKKESCYRGGDYSKCEYLTYKSMKNKKTIEKSEYTEHLGNVYNDIYGIEITPKDSFETLINKFYSVMSKWGICQGNWVGDGRTVNTPEWCICWNVFKSKIDSQFMWMELMSEPPKHLLAYGKNPHK